MRKEEGEIMPEVMERIKNIDIPKEIQEKIGLKDNWKEKISPEEVEKIFNSALKYKDALRKLSKN